MVPPIEPTTFWLYYAGGFLLLVWLLFFRRRRRGMRLHLGGAKARKALTVDNGAAEPVTTAATGGERSINVVFNYNGHSWDAYEVLGLPAGCSLAQVEAAYQKGLAEVDSSSRPFIEAAYSAIKGSQSRASGQ